VSVCKPVRGTLWPVLRDTGRRSAASYLQAPGFRVRRFSRRRLVGDRQNACPAGKGSRPRADGPAPVLLDPAAPGDVVASTRCERSPRVSSAWLTPTKRWPLSVIMLYDGRRRVAGCALTGGRTEALSRVCLSTLIRSSLPVSDLKLPRQVVIRDSRVPAHLLYRSSLNDQRSGDEACPHRGPGHDADQNITIIYSTCEQTSSDYMRSI
jgi:hypothetical protein